MPSPVQRRGALRACIIICSLLLITVVNIVISLFTMCSLLRLCFVTLRHHFVADAIERDVPLRHCACAHSCARPRTLYDSATGFRNKRYALDRAFEEEQES